MCVGHKLQKDKNKKTEKLEIHSLPGKKEKNSFVSQELPVANLHKDLRRRGWRNWKKLREILAPQNLHLNLVYGKYFFVFLRHCLKLNHYYILEWQEALFKANTTSLWGLFINYLIRNSKKVSFTGVSLWNEKRQMVQIRKRKKHIKLVASRQAAPQKNIICLKINWKVGYWCCELRPAPPKTRCTSIYIYIKIYRDVHIEIFFYTGRKTRPKKQLRSHFHEG